MESEEALCVEGEGTVRKEWLGCLARMLRQGQGQEMGQEG